MSNSKSTDHWNVLARLLGTAPPEAETSAETETPEEKAEASATPPAAEPFANEFAEEPMGAPVFEPGPTTGGAAVIEPARVEVRVPAKPAPKAAPPSKPAGPKTNHWRELASALGLEVTEPEPEPEPEAEPEPQATPEVAGTDIQTFSPAAPPSPESAPEHRERVDHGAWSEGSDQEPRHAPREERGGDPGVRTPSEPRQGSRRASLFEDPDLSLDTPGVLDAIFDEVEPDLAAGSQSAVEEHPEARESRGDKIRWDKRERAEKFVPKERERDLVFSDEPADDEVAEIGDVAEIEEGVTEGGEPETPREADEEDRSGRRRKRRRRRGGRRDPRPITEEPRDEARGEDLDREEETEKDEELIERRSAATDVRERRPVAETEELEDLDDDADDHLEDDEEEDEEGGSERLRLKHKKIPTWQQAIDAIIGVNMESRAKNPGGGAGRGRGRGRRWQR